MSRRAYDYGPVAWCYDELASIYSLGRIARSKLAFMATVEPGDRALFVGVGRGEDALAAARAGALVTAVDISEKMLARLGRVAQAEGLALDLVVANVAEFEPVGQWDHVVAHYFLNCFDTDEAERFAARLVTLVAPGGQFHVADFAPAEGGRFATLLTAVYYRLVNVAGWVVGLCALHPIPDLPGMLRRSGFEVTSVRRFPIGRSVSPAFHSVTGRGVSVPLDRPGDDGAFP